MDTRSGHSTPTTIAANPDCPACSQIKGTVARGRFDGDAETLLAAMASLKTLDFSKDDLHIIFSDPIIIGCRCANDSTHAAALATHAVGTSARHHTDAITFCSLCAEPSIDIDIAESVTLNEWRRLYTDMRLDCKFVQAFDTSGRAAVFDNDAAASRSAGGQ